MKSHTEVPANMQAVIAANQVFLSFACAVTLLIGGCNKSTQFASPAKVNSDQPTAPSIRELPDEGKLVKELLDIDAHVFEFSGTLLAVWLEAETRTKGEESIVRQLAPVAVTRSSIENDSPESIRGKFLVSGKVMENPILRILFESESKGGGFSMQLTEPCSLAPPWPQSGVFGGTGYQWKCPSELPDEGEEFVIASINKTSNAPRIIDGKPSVIRETTIKIKGKRLHGAPEPAPSEQVAVTVLRNARASVYLEGSKGDFYEGDPKTSVMRVRFPYMKNSFAGDTLSHLKQLTKLEILDLGYTQITDDDLVHLTDLRNLQELSLGRQVTTAGLEYLEGLTNLTTLRIGSQGYSARSLTNIPSQHVANAGLKHLSGLANLEVLSLGFQDAKLTDGATEHIKELANLRELYLGPNEFTESGLEQLSQLSKLEKLWLYNAKVTNAGLEHLQKLANLQYLRFKQDDVSDEALERFKNALPNCKVTP
jgi:hypothetical protein